MEENLNKDLFNHIQYASLAIYRINRNQYKHSYSNVLFFTATLPKI